MAKKKTSKKKKAKPAYIREIQFTYKKKRVSGKTPVGDFAKGSKRVAELFADMQNETKEKMVAISVGVKLKIITFEIVAIGSVSEMYVKPFDCLRAAIMVNAHGVILVHNHPSGDPEPSNKDKTFTKAVADICETGGMAFHDHVIIGDDCYFSFADEELL